jgi:hypothetical protein
MGEGGRVLVVEAFSSSGRGHIGPAPFFSLSAWLTVADWPHAGGLKFSKLPSVRGLKQHFNVLVGYILPSQTHFKGFFHIKIPVLFILNVNISLV